MNVLHLYPEKESLIAQHVTMLQRPCSTAIPDIVHVHGCWNHTIVRQAERLRRQGARLVLSPHGHLEPWIINERKLTEKTAKTLLWQKRMTSHAYTLIAHGKIETEALRKLGWNPRVETIGNAVITNTITPEAMIRQTEAIYQKVMDSNTQEHFSNETRQFLPLLLKAGITGDRRWVERDLGRLATDTVNGYPTFSEEEWRRLLLYADHENIRATLDEGIRILGLEPPAIDTGSIAAYFPTNYEKPIAEGRDVTTLTQHAKDHGLTVLHVITLTRALRLPEADDEQTIDALDDLQQTRYFRRILQILREMTGLEEGFMPLDPIDDKQTQTIRNLLTNHLKI